MDLLVSQRLAIDKQFKKYCEQHGIYYCVMSFVGYAQERDWLDLQEINNGMSIEKADAMIHDMVQKEKK